MDTATQSALDILQQNRDNLVKLGDSISAEALLAIPDNCNNNIL